MDDFKFGLFQVKEFSGFVVANSYKPRRWVLVPSGYIGAVMLRTTVACETVVCGIGHVAITVIFAYRHKMRLPSKKWAKAALFRVF